jgi:hypothetical protein
MQLLPVVYPDVGAALACAVEIVGENLEGDEQTQKIW